MADFKATMLGLDKIVKKAMESPTVQGLAGEQTWDAIARTKIFRTLAQGNKALANIPGIVLLLLGDVTKAGGFPGLNALLDTISHEMVTRAKKPEFLVEAADRALPDGVRVILDSRPKVVVAHLKGCVMAPSTKAPKKAKGATGPDPVPDGEEVSYTDAKGLPTFRWAPCCDPDLAFSKAAKADEDKMALIVRIGPGSQPGTNVYHEVRCSEIQPDWAEIPLGEALSRRYPVAECCHKLFGDGRRIREHGSHLIDWAVEAVTNYTPPTPEPPPAPGPRGVWERIVRSRLNPFGS